MGLFAVWPSHAAAVGCPVVRAGTNMQPGSHTGRGMNRLIRMIYSAAVEQRTDFSAWALAAAAEYFHCSYARWMLREEGEGARDVAAIGSYPAQQASALCRLELPCGGDDRRHVFEWLPADATVSDPRQGALQELLEHLVHAEHLMLRVRAITQPGRDAGQEPIGFATVGMDGLIRTADPVFNQHLQRSLDPWDGRTLPFELDASDEATPKVMACRGLFFRIERAAGQWHIRVSNDRRLPSVSTRELQVARKLAEGFTFKQIAHDLGLAPSTVSTHAYNLYDKLGFKHRRQLVEWVRQHGNAR